MEHLERRFVPAHNAPVEVTRRADGKKTISGYSAVFYSASDKGSEYRLWEDVVERIRPGAFDRAVKERHDVKALYNHNPDNLLGRSTSGTCRYSVDSKGLKYEVDVDESDPDHQRVVSKIERGDLTGSSFAFRATKITWEDNEGGDSVRWIDDLNLFDVGPVTYPAYESTSTGLRSEDGRGEVEEEFRLWKETMEARTEDELKPAGTPEAAGSVTEEPKTETPTEETTPTAEERFAKMEERLAKLEADIAATQKRDETPTEEQPPVEETPELSAQEDMAMRRRQLNLLKLKS